MEGGRNFAVVCSFPPSEVGAGITVSVSASSEESVGSNEFAGGDSGRK